MVDGALALMTGFSGGYAAGHMNLQRGTNIVDGGVPNYGAWECADGEYISVASIGTAPALAIEKLGLDPDELWGKDGPKERRAVKPRPVAVFKQRTRAEWCETFDGLAAVLSAAEVPGHRHLAECNALLTIEGVVQPAPAPRFKGTLSEMPRPPRREGTDSDSVPRRRVDDATVTRLRGLGGLQ